MQISAKGLKLLQDFEGCSLKAYRCDAGVLTIGYGHTGDVVEGSKITAAEAEILLQRDVAKFEAGVLKSTAGLLLTQGQFDGLVCFAFNVGLGALAKSTLLKRLKAGKTKEAGEAFLDWNKVRNPRTKLMEPLAGLTRRREAERKLFLN